MTLSNSHMAFIHEAVPYLESPSFLMQVANLVGVPLQSLASMVVPQALAEVGHKALIKVLSLAADTVTTTSGNVDFDEAHRSSGWSGFFHRVLATLTGGVGGTFGLAGLAIELPLTTSIMFRSITSIANDFGENLRAPEVRLECLTVFSHGGPSQYDDALDSTYIKTRIAMAQLVQEAADFMTRQSAKAISDAIARGSAPILIQFINRVAARFNLAVSQKFVAQSLPLIGAVTGAAINNAFTGHFNSVARYHFGIRKLERQYGEELVRAAYRRQLEILRNSNRLGG